ncbi:Mur ligase [Phellopilus nigrolimitatus]|nr:Mur ligase [Phellopilus nigrolimitatus]
MSIDLTLHRIEKLLSSFERYKRPTVHIAGTNGKGSVSALLTRIFIAADLSVGRFNSPHLVSVHDSITINDTPVSKSLYDSITTEVCRVNQEQDIHASNFEVLTITALLIFERAEVDVVVCEVGMGGRLDATNVIPDDAILISAITSIDLDHQAFLGPTVADITREKAGIVRKGKSVVLSTQKHPEVETVVKAIVESAQARLISAPTVVDRAWNEITDGPNPPPFSLYPFSPPAPRPLEVRFPEKTYNLLLPLHGDHQLDNLGTALAVVHSLTSDAAQQTLIRERLSSMNADSLAKAVRSCSWPGRLSFHAYHDLSDTSSRHLTVLADGAHNEAASQMLASYISGLLSSLPPIDEGQKRPISLTYILALSHSPPKTPASVLSPLLSSQTLGRSVEVTKNVAFLRFSPPAGMPWVKSVAPSVMAEIARKGLNVWMAPDDETTDAVAELRHALAWAADQNASGKGRPQDSLVVVAGSLYLVADLYRLLGQSNRT